MMGERTVMQEALFYSFRIEDHVPQDHLLRSVDRFVDLTGIREHLKPFYSSTGRPSVDPELMIRMLLIGYCMGIRSERRLCDEVHLNLAYRWFCRLDLDGAVPDHSTFSKNRHGRFRDSDLLRKLFEMTVERCMREGLVGAEGFAVDASLIRADVHRQRSVPGEEGLPPEAAGRAVAEYLEVLDDAAFGGATPVEPKRINLTDPAARWTAATAWMCWFAAIIPRATSSGKCPSDLVGTTAWVVASHAQSHHPNWSATNLAKASARWLMRCFSSGSSSAKVRVPPAGTNTGS